MPRDYFASIVATNGSLVELDDIQVYFEEYGRGSPLVLLHGFGGSGKNWYPFLTELSKGRRVIVIDLPGHGHSSNPNGNFTHRQAANIVFLLLDWLGVDRFSAMGLSSGGMTLLHMATSQPDRIVSQVLISASSHFPDQARQIMRRVSVNTMPPEVRRMYDACATRGDAQVVQLTRYFNELGNNLSDMNFSKEILSRISARTLVVHGDRDNFFPVEIPVFLYRSIQKSSLWIIPSGDHVPIFDIVEEFCEKSLGFLDNSEK